MSKIKNDKVELEKNIELNDCDILNDILENEKNLSNNLSIALNEMSNEIIYKEIFNIFKDTKELARNTYDLLFKNGWYILETEDENKINQVYKDYKNKMSEIN